MFDYLQKFNNLSQELKDGITSAPVVAAIEKLEKEFGVYLAGIVMRIMIRDILIEDLPKYLSRELSLNEGRAEELSRKLKDDVFFSFKNYLGIKDEAIKENVEDHEFDVIDPDISVGQKKEEMSEGFKREAEELIKKAGIISSSVEIGERIKNMVATYIRGVRDKIDTIHSLTKPITDGGAGLDRVKAEILVNLFKKDPYKKYDLPKKIRLPEDDFLKKGIKTDIAGSRDVDYDFSALVKRNNAVNKIDTSHEIAPPPPALRPIVEKKNFAPGVVSENIKHDVPKSNINIPKKITFPHVPQNLVREQYQKERGRVKINDVRPIKRIITPVDELEEMDLTSFRRLSMEANKAASIVLNKIITLGKEQYEKRVAGVNAWRLCPVFKIYLEIGDESIRQNKPISVIVNSRKARGDVTLELAEFKAILDLNKGMNF